MELTISGQLPKDVPEKEIRRIINESLEWFYFHYKYANYKDYYYVSEDMMKRDSHISNTFEVELPCDIFNVVYAYAVNRSDLFQLGVYAPDLRIGLGVTSQPYLTSYITSIAELTVTRVSVQSFGEMLKKLSRNTVRWDWDQNGRRFHLLSNLPQFSSELVLEVYRKVAPENLFEDTYFRRYVYAYGKRQLGMILSRYDFQLPGNFKYNFDTILRYADEELNQVREEIKAMTKGSFIRMKN
jgi:hypothetical protein